MRWFLFSVMLFAPLAVQAQQACYRQSDCDCVTADRTLRSGSWQVDVDPGVFAASSATIVPMNPDSQLLQFISSCDGTMRMAYTDREIGVVRWRMNLVADGATSAIQREEIPDMLEFREISPELVEFDEGTEIFAGETTMNLSFGAAPARMIMGYLPDGEDNREAGFGSITMRVGPISVPGFGVQTFWARTGLARFEYAGAGAEVTQYIRQVCRCDEVERRLAVDEVYLELHRAMRDEWGVTPEGHFRPAGQASTDINRAEAPPMRNPSYDPNAPLDVSDNWPCIDHSRIAYGGRDLESEFAARSGSANLPAEPENFVTLPGLSALGVIEFASCNIRVAAENDDTCSTPDVVAEAVRIHELSHQRDCLQAEAEEQAFEAEIARLRANPDTAHLAESSDAVNAPQCLAPTGLFMNGQLNAASEVRAYTAGRDHLEEFVARYCSR